MTADGRGVFAAGQDRALEALRLARADAYDTGFEASEWIATSRDDEHRTLSGQIPGELNRDPRGHRAP
jgi:hypothetical protein